MHRPTKLHLLLAADVEKDFAAAFHARLVTECAFSWQYGFGVLERYVAREGHARVPHGHIEDGFRLGWWVAARRIARRKGRMPAEQAAVFEKLPGWSWDPQDEGFDKSLALLQRFVSREGHARVPHGHVEEGFGLGRWVVHLRQANRRGALDPHALTAVEAIPGWTWDAWDSNFAHGLNVFSGSIEREGHARVPSTHVEHGFNLGSWVASLRRRWAVGTIRDTHARALEALEGWTWTPRSAAFDRGYEALCRLVGREGHARVPATHVEEGFNLGSWVNRQRMVYRAGSLPNNLTQTLESQDGWSWDPRDAAFDRGYEALCSFVEREGHARVPAMHVEEGFKLGTWVNRQRTVYRAGSLPSDLIQALEHLPGWAWAFRIQEEAFQRGLAALQEFVRQHGHSRVPTGHVQQGYALGSWVRGRRSLRQQGSLPADQVAALEALPGWEWQLKEAKWQGAYAAALESMQGRASESMPVPRSVKAWLSAQRSLYRRGELSAERVRLLQALPGWDANRA